ncbi:hypothetical protein DRO97_01300 [Archaeoglobales archaeon]|nr:MAG: hypothetical protein DRO97_01300 [Archaeoglobales archaeon]
MKVLEMFRDLFEDIKYIQAETKALNIYIYDAEYDDVKRLIEKGYYLAAICGRKEGFVRVMVSKTSKYEGYEVSACIYSKDVEFEEYNKLRKLYKR